MLPGVDVGHPGVGVQNQPSVASLAWSWDQMASCMQSSRTKMIDGLHDMKVGYNGLADNSNKALKPNLTFVVVSKRFVHQFIA
jgi:hypothetical protein